MKVKKLPKSLEFLTASRFWALVIGAVSVYLKTKGIIGEPEMMLIATITAGFVTVKTIDRVSEQIGGDTPTKSEK